MLIWKTLCEHYFQRLVGEGRSSRSRLRLWRVHQQHQGREEIRDRPQSGCAEISRSRRSVLLSRAPTRSRASRDDAVDVVFTSNFLEHLKTKEECDAVLAEVLRILKPGGRFIIMGPNIRYLAANTGTSMTTICRCRTCRSRKAWCRRATTSKASFRAFFPTRRVRLCRSIPSDRALSEASTRLAHPGQAIPRGRAQAGIGGRSLSW